MMFIPLIQPWQPKCHELGSRSGYPRFFPDSFRWVSFIYHSPSMQNNFKLGENFRKSKKYVQKDSRIDKQALIIVRVANLHHALYWWYHTTPRNDGMKVPLAKVNKLSLRGISNFNILMSTDFWAILVNFLKCFLSLLLDISILQNNIYRNF